MNSADSLDYALGQLDGVALEVAQREIEANPELAERLDRLRLGLDSFLDDDEDDALFLPPAGLAARTLSLVDNESKLHHNSPAILEMAPSHGRVKFGWEDLAVAATIFLASLLALAPAILRGKERWSRAACQNNLQRVGMRLHQYAAITQNRSYPYVEASEQGPVVGSIFNQLNSANLSPENGDLICPSSDANRSDAKGPNPAAMLLASKPSSFAYHVGYYPNENEYLSPTGKPQPLRATASHAIPIVADQPNSAEGVVLEGNSPNHRGQGQNVLFADGHSGWYRTRQVTPTDNDLYLNKYNRPSYGVTPNDAVLMPIEFRVQPH